jgi:signal transduction histidine kinase
VQNLLKGMNGKISFESKVDVGTVFCIKLPVSKEDKNATKILPS